MLQNKIITTINSWRYKLPFSLNDVRTHYSFLPINKQDLLYSILYNLYVLHVSYIDNVIEKCINVGLNHEFIDDALIDPCIAFKLDKISIQDSLTDLLIFIKDETYK
jgi:hypothetical protein